MTTTLDYEGTVVDVLDPAAAELDAAEIERSAAALEQVAPEASVTVSAPGARPFEIPPVLARMVATILRELGDGHTVAVVSTAEEVSTGVAARMLGFSRTHVANLVDAGILPGRRVNRHRRVRLVDLVAYQRERERRRGLLRELADLSQDLYELTPPKPTR